MKNIQIVFLLLLAFPMMQYAQEVYSLQEAIEVAKANNLTLKDQELDVQIAEAQVKQTYADGLPQINGFWDYQWLIVNAFAQRTAGDPTPFMPSGDVYDGFNAQQSGVLEEVATNQIGQFFGGLGDAFVGTHTSNAGVSIRQQVFDGVYLLGLKAARVYVDLTEVQTQTTERDIEKSVERAYLGVLIMDENLGITDDNIELINQLLKEAKATYEAGFIEQLDVDRLTLTLSTLNNQRNTLEQLKSFNLNVLKNTMNIPLDSDIQLATPIEAFSDRAIAGDILSELENPETWPEFATLEVQEQIQELNIERFKKAKLPTVDISLNSAMNYQGADFLFVNGTEGWQPNVVAGFNIGMPIFDGNRRKNQVKQAQLELEKVKVQQESLQQTVDIQIENALTSFLNARTDLNNQKENMALAQKIFDTTQIKYREGVGSSVEVNQAKQELFTAQQAYINSLYDLLLAQVDLEQALGK